jgi:hypothetical protein
VIVDSFAADLPSFAGFPLNKADRSYREQRDTTKNEWFFHSPLFIQTLIIRRVF